MSYGLGIKVDEGLIFAADSRTSAGLDELSTARKVHIFEKAGERFILLMTAGNLALSQAVVHRVNAELAPPMKRSTKTAERSLLKAETLHACAEIVGQILREIERTEAHALARHNVAFDISLILGGQIKGEAPRLFLIYPPGNFIEVGQDAPYVQIGERKYGKPILDRVLTAQSPLATAAKCALLSFDATLASNAAVGLPIDLIAYAKNAYGGGTMRKIGTDDPYFRTLRARWADAQIRAFTDLPDPEWVNYRLKSAQK
jgi:putative proteasome-type protease